MSGSRRLIESERTINDFTMAANTVSKRVDASGLLFLSFHAIWTGTPTGTFLVEVSNVEDPDEAFASADFDDLAVTGITDPAGAAGFSLFSILDFPYRWVRLKYTFGASTGVLNVHLHGKG